MAFFNIKQKILQPRPVPEFPEYVPPVVPDPQEPLPGSTPNIPRPSFAGATTLTLYICTDDNNTLNKTLSNAYTIPIVFDEDESVLNPIITLNINGDISTFNYAYIAGTGRYYYITEFNQLTGNQWQIHLRVDVLMTYKQGIKNMNAIISKTEDESLHNPDYNDGSFINQEGARVQIIHFPLGFADEPINVLITCGGDGGEE